MNNRNLLAVLFLCPIIGFSAIDDLKEERMKILSDLGLPLPDSGIKLVPRSIFNLTEEEMRIGLLEEQQMKEKGYIEENSSRPMELIHFKEHAKLQFKQYANVSKDASTHLRSSIKYLKLGFKFKGVPKIMSINSKSIVNNSIGFIPQGSFHKEGWSGAVQFFESKNIGTCAYAIRNVSLSHTAVEVALEDAAYLINSKLTLLEVRGNKKSGFDYKIKWYDSENFHELECASMKYSLHTTKSVIALANQIDTY